MQANLRHCFRALTTCSACRSSRGALLIRFLLVLSCCFVAQSSASQPIDNSSNTRSPNVVIFLADDQGWGDVSSHGNHDLATPHLDQLAFDGLAFSRFYVCAVCAPTRAELLTGRYHPRIGVRGVSRGLERLNLDESTLAEAFQAAGYATGVFGKWHNGMQYPYHPRARGFDRFVGYCSGHWGDYFDAELERDGLYFQSKGYITDVVTNHAIEFINEYKDKPLLCFVSLPTPHSPMQVPDAYWHRHENKPFRMDHRQADDHTRAALAMVENIDDNVGRLLAELDKLDLANDTIVVYFSDNGPNGHRWNDGLRGIKGSTDEGGLRSPLMIRWPGLIESGPKVSTRLTSVVDLYPTLIDLAGIHRVGDKPIDGISLKPDLFGLADDDFDQAMQHRAIVSHQRGRISVRTDRYRLDHRGRLYDMAQDPGQTRDLAADLPDVAAQLKQHAEDYRRKVNLDAKSVPRPFTLGHADWPYTELPARDAVAKGSVKRSSVHPNCSYFHQWTGTDATITWDVDVLTPGRYHAFAYITCKPEDLGTTIELSLGEIHNNLIITEAHDPPTQGKVENRIDRGESLVKDFKPVHLGIMDLPAGRAELVMRATRIPGQESVELRRVMFIREASFKPGE